MNNNRQPPPRISEGFRTGHLTVTERTPERKCGYTVWRCRCDCGNEILLDTRYLQRGTVRDCGCITRLKPNQRDITGMRFGRLTALEPRKDSKGGTVWHCRCDCGGEADVPLRQLTSGYRKSCGCLSHPPLEDLTGRKFNMLTVTGYAGKRGDRAHYWNCVCDCGGTTTVRQDYLRSGKTKSCGCLGRQNLQKGLKLIDGTSVTILESLQNTLRRNNSSGYTGVYQDSRQKLWHARITFKGKVYDLGSYKTRKEAIKARMQGEELHENFLEWYYRTHGTHDKRGEKK